jgi:cytochrome c5
VAFGQRHERSGQEVVEAACARCHATGEGGAPRIGDAKAWSARAAQGLSALSAHAIQGIRAMPAHGGSAGVSDIEIERAIVQMVNASGGRWVVQPGGATPATLRTSEQIVQTMCAKCHQEGLNGAPRIGDRAAWIPRLRKGLDSLVASAVNGCGPMPARGNAANLSDAEIRGAVIYMFNFGVPAPAASPPAAAAGSDPFHRALPAADVYLGVTAADKIRSPGSVGKPPSGKDVYYVNISLIDRKTNAPITDARVNVSVADGLGGETRTLDMIAVNQSVSYGAYFRMPNRNPYTIIARIQRAGETGEAEVKFDYRAR